MDELLVRGVRFETEPVTKGLGLKPHPLLQILWDCTEDWLMRVPPEKNISAERDVIVYRLIFKELWTGVYVLSGFAGL